MISIHFPVPSMDVTDRRPPWLSGGYLPRWVQGDQSRSADAAATAGGWLRVYGRALGFGGGGGDCDPGNVTHPAPASGTTAVLTPSVGLYPLVTLENSNRI
jgi:hypothetical protein